MSKRNHVRNDAALAKIADGMRELRRAAGKGQKEVTRETGINIGNIEAGLFNVTLGTIDRLCRYYGVTMVEFFEGLEL